MMPKASRLLFTAMVALVVAGLAALAVVLLPLIWFVVALMVCAVLSLAVRGKIRRERRHAERKAAADAQAARLTELQRQADTLRARERAVEKAQLNVMEDFRREYGL
jgi:ABC-type bacteriocin/lantibiotic exporter with double-glycine peptidase domain